MLLPPLMLRLSYYTLTHSSYLHVSCYTPLDMTLAVAEALTPNKPNYIHHSQLQMDPYPVISTAIPVVI